MEYKIRQIEEKDNKAIEDIIRKCLIEFGGNRDGLAWSDTTLGELSKVYNKEGYRYWVVANEKDNPVGGVGIGKLDAVNNVCELQKMYCLKEVRGKGMAKKLMEIALKFASKYYEKCYIETLSNMLAANKLYQKYGFAKLDRPIINTEHYACDVWYIKDLKENL